ncbi:MAG: type II toxin-antitoxin system HicA family toxin [Thermoanaerobaculia bacterium]
MKLAAFLRELAQKGCELHRHGGRHDLYLNPKNGRKAPVPRHSEIKDSLCRVIRKQLDLEP